ncbi:MAG TPA: 50S ribosomal protein L11 methyltransferase [Gammaproteobacteria bacterium]|nr:50S ribosomal protein L11 methyltransferase [Gammaproteobacteria bacterium]
MTDNVFWYEAVFTVPERHVEMAESVLYGHGALSVTLQDAADQPLLEPAPGETPLWNLSVVTGLFSQDQDPDALLRSLQSALAGIAGGLRIARVENQPWERAWMEDYRPMHFGRRLSVYPGHIPPDDPERVNIILDPGLAFGTGTHPTTALCLCWLDAREISGKTCVDYGCGSGILAVAALSLGAASVYAVDIDQQALIAAEQNALRNGIASGLHIMSPDKLGRVQADIVLANILSNTIVLLAQTLTDLVRPGGELVLSGILHEQAEQVRGAFAHAFEFEPQYKAEDWVLLAARKF